MRALRDFNVPKIVTDDMPVFMGLIGDLFPALDVPRKRDLDFEKQIKQAVLDLKLQAEDNFVLKVMNTCIHTHIHTNSLTDQTGRARPQTTGRGQLRTQGNKNKTLRNNNSLVVQTCSPEIPGGFQVRPYH